MENKMPKTTPTITVQIFMAGDIATAKQEIRSYCWYYGFCVTVTATDFIYTGGEETGFIIGLQNYPRFPVTEEDALLARAHELIARLMPVLNQRSALIVAPGCTEWVTCEPPGVTDVAE